MTIIKSTKQIAAPAESVYQAAKNVEKFAELLPNLDRVTILEDDGTGHTTTRWEGTVSIGPLTRQLAWTERDYWDDAQRTCTFELVEGDMKKYEGTWTFAQMDNGCLVELNVEFELGIPLLGPMLGKIVDQLMQANCDQLLVALAELAT